MTVALRSAVTGKCESSSFVILFQDRLGYSKPLVIPYETEDFFPIFVKKKAVGISIGAALTWRIMLSRVPI